MALKPIKNGYEIGDPGADSVFEILNAVKDNFNYVEGLMDAALLDARRPFDSTAAAIAYYTTSGNEPAAPIYFDISTGNAGAGIYIYDPVAETASFDRSFGLSDVDTTSIIDGGQGNKVIKAVAVYGNKQIFDLDKEIPLGSGYYTLTTAVAAIPVAIQKRGLQITFKTSLTGQVNYIFDGVSTDFFSKIGEWKSLDNTKYQNIKQDLISVGSSANSSIADNGGFVGLAPSYTTFFYKVEEGWKVALRSTLPGSGGALKRIYGLYSGYPTTGTFISGSASSTGEITENTILTIPAGVEYIALSTRSVYSYEVYRVDNPFVTENLETEINKRAFLPKKEGYLLNNLADLFFGSSELWNEVQGSYPAQLTNGRFIFGVDAASNSISRTIKENSLLGKGITLSASSGNTLNLSSKDSLNANPFHPIFTYWFPSDINTVTSSFGFWVDRSTLNGNGITIKSSNGTYCFLNAANLGTKGYNAHQGGLTAQAIQFTVKEVNEDYSYLEMAKYGNSNIGVGILSDSGTPVTSLKILAPVLLNKVVVLDPYFYYKSESEKRNSNKISKRGLIVGDSQHQDRISHRVINRKTGINLISMARGGHSIQYKSASAAQTNFFWFYHQNLFENIILQAENIDFYILPFSTNDATGNYGELTDVAIQAVIDNYPYHGDDVGTVSSKLAAFNALTQTQRENIFGFKQTFAAYIMQCLLVNPKAKFLLASTPISVPGFLTGAIVDGKGVWEPGFNGFSVRNFTGAKPQGGTQSISLYNIYQGLKDAVLELKEWFHTYYSDTMNESGVTFENANEFIFDGTHWDLGDKLVKFSQGNSYVSEIDKM